MRGPYGHRTGPARKSSIFFISYGTRTGPVRVREWTYDFCSKQPGNSPYGARECDVTEALTGACGKRTFLVPSLQWRHNERNGVLNHGRLDCLLKRLLRRSSKLTSKFRVNDLCEGNPPVTVTCGFPSQRASKMFTFDYVIMIYLTQLLQLIWRSSARRFCLVQIIPCHLYGKSHYLYHLCFLLIATIRKKFHWNLNKDTIIFI